MNCFHAEMSAMNLSIALSLSLALCSLCTDSERASTDRARCAHAFNKKKKFRVAPLQIMPPKASAPSRVVVHPIVLLSVVDHFNRLSRIGNQRRVVGVLLGSWRKGNVVDIATSFAGN